eukprot:CAMPEP_0171676516 /NCGR_PEP_ID=MMETSP0990-20121206/54490_1 /TAXON_ID=483369 /ORGANISM="non described non described, Strain CCMP2098" /LENGTH=54 /DNA_ID=CAMNT_0012262729 /DNA_START=187 /DNA_END=351 /DNA_ORIENTATION=-
MTTTPGLGDAGQAHVRGGALLPLVGGQRQLQPAGTHGKRQKKRWGGVGRRSGED